MLRALKLTNFRSYKSIQLAFEDNLTVVVGPNAVGKTNLLESIFVSSTTKSFRAPDHQLINTHEDFYRIEAQFDNDIVELSLQSKNQHQTKKLVLNAKKQSLHSLLGRNPVTLFEPHDMDLFDASPSRRRSYIDTILCQLSPSYTQALSLYKRALKQRNSLLFMAKNRGARPSSDELFVWDVQLVSAAKTLIVQRKDVITKLSDIIQSTYRIIANTPVELKLAYEPNIDCDKTDYLQALSDSQSRDVAIGHTMIGPHRDDMVMDFKGGNVVSTASRGETRTVILALKIAELHLLEEVLGKKPILLLDDVFSELDKDRRKHLMELIAQQQTIITTTEVDSFIPKQSYIIDLSGAGV